MGSAVISAADIRKALTGYISGPGPGSALESPEQILAADIALGEHLKAHAVPVYGKGSRFFLPVSAKFGVPGVGEPLVYTTGARAGQPMKEGGLLTGVRISNGADKIEQGLRGDGDSVIIIGGAVTPEKAALLQKKLDDLTGGTGDPEDLTLPGIKTLLQYAEKDLGLNDIWTGKTADVRKASPADGRAVAAEAEPALLSQGPGGAGPLKQYAGYFTHTPKPGKGYAAAYIRGGAVFRGDVAGGLQDYAEAPGFFITLGVKDNVSQYRGIAEEAFLRDYVDAAGNPVESKSLFTVDAATLGVTPPAGPAAQFRLNAAKTAGPFGALLSQGGNAAGLFGALLSQGGNAAGPFGALLSQGGNAAGLDIVLTNDEAKVRALVAAGYCPIECSINGHSIVDGLVMDHHEDRSDLEAVSVRAIRDHAGARAQDPRFVVVGACDADAAFAIAALSGLIPKNERTLALGTTIALLDTDPIGKNVSSLPHGDYCTAWWESHEKARSNRDTRGAVAAVLDWQNLARNLEAPDDATKQRLAQARAGESARAETARQDLLRGETGGGVCLIRHSEVFGFDVWHGRKEEAPANTRAGWENPVVVIYNQISKTVALCCPNRAVAEELFGAGGLRNVYGKLKPGLWGGREQVGGSQRGLPMTPEDAERVRQEVAALVASGMPAPAAGNRKKSAPLPQRP